MERAVSNTYVPQYYTICAIDNIGRTMTQYTALKSSIKTRKNHRQELPKFARRKVKTYDKENLLEQMRKESRRQTEMRQSKGRLHHMLTTSQKMRKNRGRSSRVDESRCEDGQQADSTTLTMTMRRQMQQLRGVLQKQRQEMTRIKKSKKYTRFEQLKAISEVYESEISELREKVRALREERVEDKRKVRQEVARRVGAIGWKREVCCSIAAENTELMERVEEITERLEESKMKGVRMMRERDRLLRDIDQLQNKTGTFYIKVLSSQVSHIREEGDDGRSDGEDYTGGCQYEWQNVEECRRGSCHVTQQFRDSEFLRDTMHEHSFYA